MPRTRLPTSPNRASILDDGEEATLRISEKGGRRRTIGIHFEAAQAIREYIQKAGMTSGPLFRPQLNSRSQRLGDSHMLTVTMYQVVQGYLRKLPGAIKHVRDADGTEREQFVYTPHSLRATTATLLLDAGVDIMKAKETPWPPARHDHANLRQAPSHNKGERLARRPI